MSCARRPAPRSPHRGLLPVLLLLMSGMSASGQTTGAGSSTRPRDSRTRTAEAAATRPAASREKSSARDAEQRRSVGVVLEALRANPLVAPYPILVSWKGDRVHLSGKVGTRQVYDLAIGIMIDSGIPFRESLVIDTAETYRVAQAASSDPLGPPNLQGRGVSSLPYVYPPPLFGRVDDPFFGLEPPAVSFPATSLNAHGIPPGPSAAPAATRRSAPPGDGAIKGNAQISVDELGRVLLRGEVADEQTRVTIEQEAASVPGVTQVINELTIATPAGGSDDSLPDPLPVERQAGEPGQPANVPPPPAPHPPADAVRVDAPKPKAAKPGAQPVGDRVADALAHRPDRAENPVKVLVSAGRVTLSGRVTSVYEAMIAFRAAQQTPGVREVVDQLEFPMPEDGASNPLLQKGKPEDVQPYLDSHIRRNLGETGHLERITLQGKVLEVHGTVGHADDKKRIMAILRSIPILRGFQIEPNFQVR